MVLIKHDNLYIILNLLMYTISLCCFIIGLAQHKKHKELSHLYIYALASFIQNTVGEMLIKRKIFGFYVTTKFGISAMHVFLLIEFVCIYYFFFKTKIISDLAKKMLVLLFACFLCFYIRETLTPNFFKQVGNFYFLDSCFILIPCFVYLIQLFAKPPTLNLLNEPSFWFNSGILIFFTLTLPVFFMINYFRSEPMLAAIDIINFIGYSIIFLFLIRAYLCRPKTAI